MMTPVQEQNVRWQEITRMRMEQAQERRWDAKTPEQQAHAQKVYEAAVAAWQEVVAEAHAMMNH